jgi:capsular polysaccharide biosynthesis protein
LDLQRLSEIVWHSLLGIVILTIVAGAAAFGISMVLPRQWEAESRLLVGSLVETDTSQLEAYQQLASTYAEVATSTPIMQRVIQRLGLSDDPKKLGERVTIRAAIGQAVVKINTTADDPTAAADLANAFASEIVRLGQPATPSGESLVTIYQPGEPPEDPSSPRILINTLIAASVGFVVGVGLAVLITMAQQARRRRTAAQISAAGVDSGPRPDVGPSWPGRAASSGYRSIAVTAVAPMPATAEPWALYAPPVPSGPPQVQASAEQSDLMPAASANGAHAAADEPTVVEVVPQDTAPASSSGIRAPRVRTKRTTDDVSDSTSAGAANSQEPPPSSRAPRTSAAYTGGQMTDLDADASDPVNGTGGPVPRTSPARGRKGPDEVAAGVKKRRSAVKR